MTPLHAKLRTELRRWAIALDRAATLGKWTRVERDALAEMLVAVGAELLSDNEDDAAIAAIFARHGGMDINGAQHAPDVPGHDSESPIGIGVDGAAGESWQHPERPEPADAPRRKSAAAVRRAEEAQRVTQSLRQVFRKLASALHPDREPDVERRAAKTELMAQVNEAYAREDLLALLELQLRIEQIDAEHLATVDEARLKHYNKVLAEQLTELRTELREQEMQVQLEFGMSAEHGPDPRRVAKELEGRAARLRAHLAQVRREVEMFADETVVRRWLKAQRRSG
jgi:hypothetical protein